MRPLNWQRQTTDPQLQDEVTAAIRARQRALTPRDNSVDGRDTAIAAAILQASEALVLKQEHKAQRRE